jgi:hypothetical protein
MAAKIVAAAVLVLALSVPANAGQPPSDVCPEGFLEIFNANQPGCSFCAARC